MDNILSKSKKSFIVFGILFVIYNFVLFIIAGFTGHSATFWISYFFVILSFVLSAVSYGLNFIKGHTLRDWFLGYPILHWSVIYIVVELITSIVFMLIPTDTTKIATVVQFLLASLYVIFAASCFLNKKVIEELEPIAKEKVYYIRNIKADLETVANLTEELSVKESLMKLIDVVCYSDPMSHESLSEIESNIERKVSILRNYIDEKNNDLALDTIKKITDLFEERNRKCKILK
jgi:hypothetical protein